MPRHLVNISISLEGNGVADPPGRVPNIMDLEHQAIEHQANHPDLAQIFPGWRQEDLPIGKGWTV